MYALAVIPCDMNDIQLAGLVKVLFILVGSHVPEQMLESRTANILVWFSK